ncbi:uncharacterized protein TNCV_3584281 [Trichonephila clavipes]|nr:uncharacterized protein TNCV_3584281 [Trichonephila clavipes]
MNDSEKVTLYLQILRKYVNFPFPKEINEDMQEPQMEFKNSNAEDLKSVILNEDSKEALGFIKQETSAENIEQEIEKSAPKKYKAIIKKIILFIQKHREEIYWTPDKELIVDGKIIRNTNVVHLITHLVRDRKKIKPFRKVHINPGVLIAHAKALEKATAKYPIDRVNCKVFSIPQSSYSFIQDNVFSDKCQNE